MSDLFMNMQRQRRRHKEQQQPTVSADVTRSPTRRTRAATPGRALTTEPYGPTSRIYQIPQITKDCQVDGVSNGMEKGPEEDLLANILSLKLRKPQHWKWELTTSKSCSNISLPRILLYDHKGNLLVDAPPGGTGCHEQVFKQEDSQSAKQHDKSKKRPYNDQRSATTNLTHSIRKALEKEFDGLQIEEVCPQPPSVTTLSTASTNTTMRTRRSRKSIELNTKDLTDISRRSSSARGVRFHVKEDVDLAKIPAFLPTPPSTTTPTSSSSGPREKRKYRRSHSSGRSSSHSLSILERLSYQKCRFSSPESGNEPVEGDQPRYSLRTDEAGTLLVHENSSSSSQNPTRRRKKSHKFESSNESIRNKSSESQTHSAALSPTIQASSKTPSDASPSASTKERRRKYVPVRRHKTEGNILANKHLSSSEDEPPAEAKVKEFVAPLTCSTLGVESPAKTKVKESVAAPPCPTLGEGCSCKRQQRKYVRNETKDLNSSISAVGLQRNGKIR